MQNLRSVFAQLYRGGRSTGSRNFSSPPVSGAGGRDLAIVVWTSLVRNCTTMGLVSSTLFGYGCFIASGVVEARKKSNAVKEQLRLRRIRHDELIAKAKRDLRLD
ncbi:unnamed protein product [Arabidopsis lyrata]|uniref:Expressed protein n=1 Tax=Arabidopsis lyrata subsp. lyrata TaxID=81972 RepID=D7L0C1_ARALL|nr:uncharacterized protein LOC9320418 [Arabidopsis lyrata subsp. lyrata]EFH58526.1 expressed protein [Arabidopsis lyrata subsp. lyrata]CAH8259107.1 unnamed protein product [Arabidopsis lyrata]|eukprot:XP_002882267.1 uncharacterized protein LOC9320418 [Arabidopsis lyrata subsp. lyrata]